jgi:bifunctional non-homologous end joining protein LigD
MREPFDDPAFVFENKWDGFRALAFLTATGATIASRNGNPFRRFAPLATALRSVLGVRDAVIDGEVVCLDGEGRPQFRELLFSRAAPSFVAFDLLALNGRDLRRLPLPLHRGARFDRIVRGRAPGSPAVRCRPRHQSTSHSTSAR